MMAQWMAIRAVYRSLRRASTRAPPARPPKPAAAPDQAASEAAGGEVEAIRFEPDPPQYDGTGNNPTLRIVKLLVGLLLINTSIGLYMFTQSTGAGSGVKLKAPEAMPPQARQYEAQKLANQVEASTV
eukprot:TRINITY_DN3214_c0_g1_i1.p2 TRINITY_DN3214_c0_g1~~TRINITY_DN3214_c0_g1_i1.p2  ORF type:complete len:128 (+),score=26.29 TRINITY_DN3214_c0_g1_i1:2-385(+)